jgi:16S rRNA (guanine966-N2)-methyltransferase
LSFEALSRGARHAVVVDDDSKVIRQLKQSAGELGLGEAVRAIRMSLLGDPEAAVRKLPVTKGGFDLVFVDAPYSEIDSVPVLLDALVREDRLARGAWIVIERPARHAWKWPNGLAHEADYRYGDTGISLGVYRPEKGSS